MATTKRCSRCRTEKDVREFSINRAKRDGLNYYCKACDSDRNRQRRLERGDQIRGRQRENDRKRLYGLTPEAYSVLREKQGDLCAICHSPCATGRALAIDHCHETGEVRGLLCMKCNRGLGMFNDNSRLLEEAIRYLNGEE